jgi:alpha-ketoglutarate-dependent taurine dioxygenase
MDARNAFSEFLEEEDITKSPSKLTMRLQPGEIVVFNNRRMLHGRNEFKVEGEDAMRKLIGCYVTSDDWKSALALSLVGKDKVYRIGNGDQL